ncbi:hypothetical protein LWI29_011887 [Acer saccharum]|uniref:Transmembrane protein n=1 Tax=Acer saccharum TaxID=4024 RepID=A0AA39SFZ5_ACESA|nr:hypothetical protein LWI29_011887 [Acer saccharum]
MPMATATATATDGDGDDLLLILPLSISGLLLSGCLSLRFHTKQSFCDGDGDEGNGDLHGNSDPLLLLPLTLGFLVVVVTVCIRIEQSFYGKLEGNLVHLWGIRMGG